jgi:hypothetical protein
MSSVVIAGDTSGTVTLQAPAVSGTTTLTLPTISGGTLVTSDSSGNVFIGGTTQNTSTKPVYSITTAKAWVVFNGSPLAVISSFNVSSVTRTSAGLYVINFTNAMVDANYGTQMSTSTSSTNLSVSNNINYGASQTTSATTVGHLENSALTDSNYVCVSIFR